MSTLNINAINSCVGTTGGISQVPGQGAEWLLTIGGSWVNGDEWTITLLDQATGFSSQFGAGFATGIQPSQLETFNNKVYALSNSQVNFSAVALPTIWNDPNASFNGFFDLLNYWSTPETLVAMAPYQGRLVFFSRWTIQIFIVDANPLNWQQAQVMPNMGTLAPLSVQSLGDLDVLFLSDTGIRSLRVRDSSLYAFVNDIGSPVDQLITTSLQANSSSANAAACAVVDPQSGRYWCYLNGTIYVLSYYPSAKITGWATYLPTYVSTKDSQTHTFTPTQFIIFNGQVYAIGTSDEGSLILQYGGVGGNVYDTTVAAVMTPWLDMKKPGVRKSVRGFDGALTNGTWAISGGMNPAGENIVNGLDTNLNSLYTGTVTFQKGQIPWVADGFHMRLQAVSSGSGYARISSLVFEFDTNEDK